MSPARRSVNPQQEALDLGLPEPSPVKTKPTNTKPAKVEAAQGEPVDSTIVEPTRTASATRAQQGTKDTPLLSDEQLRTTAELTVRDLAAYARGEVSRAELSERAAQRASAPYRKALKTLKHSLGPAAHTMTDDVIYELVDIALAARQATQPEAHQPEAPARKAPARKKPAQKNPTQKKTVQKELAQNKPSPQENDTAARATSARPQKVTKANEEAEQKPAPKKSVPEVEAEKPATEEAEQKPAPKKPASTKAVVKKAPAKKAPAKKASASKASASKTAAPKTTAKKASAKKATTEKVAAEKVAATKPASAAAEAKSRALARYASEDRIENAPPKKYLPAPSAKAISTHLDLHTVGQMLEYFPRKYLPRGELSSFAELVEGQDVTIIARVVHVSTRTMAARRGKITEVTITDRLSDATGQDAPAGFGAAGFGTTDFGAGGPVSVVPGRANRPGASGAPAQNWQATGMHNPRINALAHSAQNPATQNPAQGRGAQPASYSGYADSYGQDSFAQDSFAQGGLFGVPAPSTANPGAGVLIGSQMKLSFFNAWTAAREIREGETMMFSGRVGIYRGEYTLTNPHYALLSKDASGADVTDAATAPVPVYRAPAKLPTDRISGYMAQLLEKVPLKELEDPVPYTIRRARKVPSLEWTYRALHTPDSEDTWRAAQAQMRYREAFVLQSALARLHSVRAAHLTQPRPAVEGGLADRLLQVLPYELTEGQQKVGAEIAADLSSESPMNRLLQGDVGSGKTVVALRAMLQVADAGGQSAMLAPTEVLAEQHLRSVLDILGDMAAPEDSDADDSAAGSAEGIPAESGEEPGRVRVRLLTASMGTRAKRKVLQELADGTAQIVIGTHALLSDEVSFHDLGLVVVDEQHRFGVEQRDGLRGTDGALPHRLVMTATPIPRTVAMTVFGDLDVSVLDTLPAGRQKISTHVVPLAEKPAWASRLWRRAREEIDAGHQVYVVVPKIGEDGDSLEEGAAFFGASSLNGAGTGAGNSAQGYFGQGGNASSDGKVQLTSVASMYSYLSAEDALVGVRIGTLHGRMDPTEKTAVMTAFERGEIDLLISTTVIEVGVNVPNATLMIIMDADRFGISGLHQLRGRVGRGGYAGTCLLVTRQEEGGVSRERLDAVASTTDGFELSRIDLAQRREGDILGAAQSGSKSTLRFLRALADADIIERAREDARSVVEKDPTLAKHPSLARTIDRALDADREAFLGRG